MMEIRATNGTKGTKDGFAGRLRSHGENLARHRLTSPVGLLLVVTHSCPAELVAARIFRSRLSLLGPAPHKIAWRAAQF
jgi:hypothetical protein